MSMKILFRFKSEVLTVLFCILLLYFVGGYRVIGQSMNNTFKTDDVVIQLKHANVSRGDIVTVWSDALNELLCKRVIGVAGDKVEIEGKSVKVNGVLLDEPYALYTGESYDSFDFTVPEGEIFVLGDNRNNSVDSRRLGCFSTELVKGVYLFNFTSVTGIKFQTLSVILKVAWALAVVVLIISVGLSKNKKNEVGKENE